MTSFSEMKNNDDDDFFTLSNVSVTPTLEHIYSSQQFPVSSSMKGESYLA